MKTSVNWINDYLAPPANAAEQAELLTRAGLPFDGREDVLEAEDIRQEIETTSNRGDCVCHFGLAREIAAISGRSLTPPKSLSQRPRRTSAARAAEIVTVTNREKELCPLYTTRIMRGVKVGPSPAWLTRRLRAIGQNPRNNIVDASNFVLFELGQPTHVFDLARLAGPAIIIRKAMSGEPFLPIGEGAAQVKLSESDLVIADAQSPVAIAGVKGGALSAVSESTRDILIEAATFDHVTVRNTSRRLGIASDSSYRYERGVHAAQVDPAAERLVDLLLDLCGGELCEGVVADGAPIAPPRRVTMRPARARALLGIPLTDQQIIEPLRRLGFDPELRADVVHCTVPPFRLDIEREVDLVEEVLRMMGTDSIPVVEAIQVRVAPPQPTQKARQAVHEALVGMGFMETVTHSLIAEAAARAFTPPDVQLLRVDDDRARAEPVLRPSVLPSLLRVFALNRDNGVAEARLFESAAAFGRWRGSHVEFVNLAFIHPVDAGQPDLRFTRGVIERLTEIVLGPGADLIIEPLEVLPWLSPGASARIGDRMLGTFGLLSRDVARQFGLEDSLGVAEIGLPAFYDRYPPQTQARALPSFPPIERDISAVVAETVAWRQVKELVGGLKLAHLGAVEFVTTYRGRQIGPGRKSLTLRLRFRAPDRTLTHEEVDASTRSAMKAITEQLGAEIRA